MNYSIITTQFGEALIGTIDTDIFSLKFGKTKEDVLALFREQYEKQILLSNLTIDGDLSSKIMEVVLEIAMKSIASNKMTIRYLTGTQFQRKVWDELRTIPYGKTITYKQLAEQVGAPKAHRAVATACKLNPMPVIIPCHRVVPSSGGIGNYALGVEMKKALLDREKA